MKTLNLPVRVRPRSVCQLCDYSLQQPGSRRAFLSASSLKAPSLSRQKIVPRVPARNIATTVRKPQAQSNSENVDLQLSERIVALKAELADLESRIQAFYKSDRVEKEAVTMQLLDGLEEIAQQAIAIQSQQPNPRKATIRQSSAGAILSGLGGEETVTKRTTMSRRLGLEAVPSPAYFSKIAEGLLKHEKVFISPEVLSLYIHLQRLLNQPKTIPEALYLYANKAVPIEGSSPPKYTHPSPKAARQAVPAEIAEEALTAAIQAKDLTLALAVVDHSYCAPAWGRRRLITKFGVPGFLATITPFALYMIAQELSVYSNLMDPWLFKVNVFMGMGTYILCTTTLGYVALTTYNDTHDRVVWQPGTLLTERYLREDERAALDRIACAWGFKELWKRGEEEGQDWEGLRRWILLRGMVLDKPDLMPGMNTTAHPREL